jgi:hypothetical protein
MYGHQMTSSSTGTPSLHINLERKFQARDTDMSLRPTLLLNLLDCYQRGCMQYIDGRGASLRTDYVARQCEARSSRRLSMHRMGGGHFRQQYRSRQPERQRQEECALTCSKEPKIFMKAPHLWRPRSGSNQTHYSTSARGKGSAH